jgi:two-component system nitrogen regulation response regulator NtrX
MPESTILIIDDEKDICDLCCDILSEKGFKCLQASNSDQALKLISEKMPSIIILDVWLQGSNLDGLGILEIIKSRYQHIPVIVISGHGTIEIAVNSIRMGAYDYIEKPFNSDKLLITVERAHESVKLKQENTDLRRKFVKKTELTGHSQAVSDLKNAINNIPGKTSNVLIEGSAGSGRELIAKLIHRKLKGGPFVKLSASLLSSDNMQKSFLDGNNGKVSLMELVNHGTLFISEIADLSLYAQHMILTLIKEANKPNSKYSICVIASTSYDLKKAVKTGNFLTDLHTRMSAFVIKAPSLKDRQEDIPDLCNCFIAHFEKTSNLIKRDFEPQVFETLAKYEWPGSIRQLKNLIEWLLILAQIQGVNTITADMLPQHIFVKKQDNINAKWNLDTNVMDMPLREAREEFEKRYLLAQMEKFNNNISKTSIFIGMERSALHRKLKSLQLHCVDTKSIDQLENSIL